MDHKHSLYQQPDTNFACSVGVVPNKAVVNGSAPDSELTRAVSFLAESLINTGVVATQGKQRSHGPRLKKRSQSFSSKVCQRKLLTLVAYTKSALVRIKSETHSTLLTPTMLS